MIFVILGTQKFQLNRLLMELDRYKEENLLQDEIIAQIGHSTYLPKHFQYTRFLNKEEFDHLIRKADLVITHSGVGSIITAIGAGKPVIVYPRLEKYGEHVDDHQADIAEAFCRKKYVLCCREEDDLLEKIRVCKSMTFEKYFSQTGQIVNIIEDYLKEKK